MTEPRPDKIATIDLKRAAEVAGVITIFGVIGQFIGFMAATRFYRAFGLQADQLGVTPLNALLRVSSTTELAVGLGFILVYTLHYTITRIQQSGRSSPFAPNTFRDPATGQLWQDKLRKRRKGLVRVGRVVEAPRWSLLASLVVIVLSLGGIFSTLAGTAAESFKSGGGGTKSWNVVSRDLAPVRGTAFWPKKEELPVLGNMPPTNVRKVGYLGTSGSITYLYDEASKQTLVVPSGQVQVYVTPPVSP